MQFFFELDIFLWFCDVCVKVGIDVLIMSGILLIENWKGVCNFVLCCGILIFVWLDDVFEKVICDGCEDFLVIVLCIEICFVFIDEGVDKLYFYIFNILELICDICYVIGVIFEVKFQNVV